MPSSPVYPVQGLPSIAQKKLTSTIAGQGYQKSAWGYAITGSTKGDTSNPLSLGRPGEGAVFSGLPVTDARKATLLGRESYNPRIQQFVTNNTQVVGPNGSMPTVANTSTQSHSQVAQAAADFKWFSKLVTPIYMRKYDLDMAVSRSMGNNEALGMAVGDLIEKGVETATNEHLDNLFSRLIYGNPVSQFTAPADDLQGLLLAGNALGSTLYGAVDRSQLTTRDGWYAYNVNTNIGLDIYKIVQDLNVKRKFKAYGSGKKIILCGGDNYTVFRNQVLARSERPFLETKDGMGLPQMAKMGVEREVLVVDDCYVMWEPFLDTVPACTAGTTTPLYTAQPTYVIAVNLELWTLMFHPLYNIRLTELKDISNLSVGAPDAEIGFIKSMCIQACDRPLVGVASYTALA
jgi:hypothetical protein